jgi:hypothetical protein
MRNNKIRKRKTKEKLHGGMVEVERGIKNRPRTRKPRELSLTLKFPSERRSLIGSGASRKSYVSSGRFK